MEFVTIVLGLFLSYALIQLTFTIFGLGRPNNLPPGPTPFPIMGNLHLLGDHPNQSLANLAKIHGPIMFLKLGRINTLVISSAAAARLVLQKQDLAFSSRNIMDAHNARNHSQNSTFWLPVGPQWRTHRRILNNHVFSGESLDANQYLRNKKVEELVAYCRKASECNKSVDIGQAAYRTSLNIVSNIVFSKDLTDPFEDSGQEFKELIGKIMMETVKPNLVDVFPVLKKMDPQGIRKKFNHLFGKVVEIFEELIEERLVMKKRLMKQDDDDDDDLLDKCLKISCENPDEFSREHIMSMFLDLFLAGTDTISSSLEWALAELIRNPHVMAKAKEELEEIIGKGKNIEEVDFKRLPYLWCIVKETLRIHPPAPFLVPRKVETEVELNGYTIPKDTQVLVNAWAIARDPTSWEDPLEFKPERFLTLEIDVQGHDFKLIPFGAGRRLCPGLSLAIRMVPLMLGSLLNNFDWNLDNEIILGNMDMTEKFGITVQKAKPLCVVPKPLR